MEIRLRKIKTQFLLTVYAMQTLYYSMSQLHNLQSRVSSL